MRRKEKEVTDLDEIESIIRKCTVCRLGLVDGDQPYIVPMNFGYENRTIYLHSAKDGRKIDALKKNAKVCIEFDTEHVLLKNEKACRWGMRYDSVIAFGKAQILKDARSKRQALDILMKHYSDDAFEYADETVDAICIIRVAIDTVTGKRSG